MVESIGLLLYFLLNLFLGLMFVRLVFDYVQMFARSWTPKGIVLVLLEIVYSITDPPIKLARRYIPPLRLGSIALDLGFLAVFVAVILARSVVEVAFFS